MQWAVPNSPREKKIKEIISQESPDIICITEGYLQSWMDYQYVVSSQEDYGYKIHKGRRKVILISTNKWEQIDTYGDSSFPEGRFVRGRTHDIDVIGVCIPWQDAHVKSGRRDRKSWEDHILYLSALKKYMGSMDSPFVVMGDYNQRIPKKFSPVAAYEALTETFDGLEIWSKGIVNPIGKQAIDHIAMSKLIKKGTVKSIDNFQEGQRLSDHFGLIIDILITS